MTPLPPLTPAPDPLRCGAGLVAALAALPVLLTYLGLAVYAYPTSDDWGFAAAGRDAGVAASLAGYWSGNGGRWLTAFLLYALGWIPRLPEAYPLLIALTLAGFVAANALVARCLGLTTWRGLLVATAVLSSVQLTALPLLDGIGNLGPHLATPETLYWVSGAWPYSSAYLLLAGAAWLVLTPVPRWLAWSGCLGLGAALSGLSELAGLLGLLLGVALGLGGCRRGWILGLAAGVGFGVAAAAPGNLARLALLRQDGEAGAGLAQLPAALLAGLRFSLGHLRDWLLDPAIACLGVALVWWGALLPPTPGAWRRRCAVAAAAVVLGTWGLALPALALVGFLEARHEGLVSFAAVAGILVVAVLAGRAWPEVRQQRRWRLAAAGWILAAAAWRWGWPSPLSPLGAWTGPVLFGGLGGLVLLWVRGRPGLLGGVLALALLAQPAWWQAIADGFGKAPKLLHLQQFRDRAVRQLVAGGSTDVILPWLGGNERLPRTLRLYEVQSGWMADGYAAYFGLRNLAFSDRILGPVPWRRRPPPPPAAAGGAP